MGEKNYKILSEISEIRSFASTKPIKTGKAQTFGRYS